jgi:hypothetical protein
LTAAGASVEVTGMRHKTRKARQRKPTRPVLLAGGNPQIAKADGDAPVRAYIEAMPGWKRDVGRRLHALIVRAVPGVQKAVKWNSPLYGVEGRGFFLGIHVFTRYVKVAFFRGASLRPLPPGDSKSPDMRYLDIHENDRLDEARLTAWVKQASRLPGWIPGSPSATGPREEMGMKKGSARQNGSPSRLIDARIAELGDWRGRTLGRLRALVKQADPDVVEEWKWEVPVWSHDGLICTGEVYKEVVKMTFARGAALEDPSGLFNSSLGGNTRRAIDFREGEAIDAKALKALVRAAVKLNQSKARGA